MSFIHNFQLGPTIAGPGLQKVKPSDPISLKLTSDNALVVDVNGVDLRSIITGNRVFIGDISISGNLSLGSSNSQEKLTLPPNSNIVVEMSPPQYVAASPTSGGYLPTGLYTYQVVASDGQGYTLPTPKVHVSLDNNAFPPGNAVKVSWVPVSGSPLYHVFRVDAPPGVVSGYFPTSGTNFVDVGDPPFQAPTPSTATAYSDRVSSTSDSYHLGGNYGFGTSNPNSTLTINGSISYSVYTNDASYSITSNDYVILAKGGNSGVTVTLPDTAGISGRTYVIKKVDSGPGIVTITSSSLIDGNQTYMLSAQNKYVTVVNNGVNWFIVANN